MGGPSTLAGRNFDIFTAEPVLLARMRSTPRRWIWFAGIPATAVLLIGELSAMFGSFGMPHVRRRICADLTVFLRLRHTGCVAGVPQDNRFPLVRDLPSLLAIVILTATPYLIYRQWSALEGLLPGMERAGSLTLPADQNRRKRVYDEIDRANRRFRKISRLAPLLMASSFICMLTIALCENKLGVYYSLAPGGADRRQWGTAAYAHWWANWSTAPPAATCYLVIGTFGIYLIAIMNCAGSRVLLALWKVRAHLHYGVDMSNADGYFGWQGVRDALVPTYMCIALHGLALVAVGIALPFPFSIAVMTPVVAQWLLTLPVYTGLPLLLTRQKVKSWKLHEGASLRNEIQRVEANRSALLHAGRYYQEFEALAQRMERLRRVPNFPFSRPRDLLLAAANLLATAGGVYSLFILWY